jgi:hypothetical protein
MATLQRFVSIAFRWTMDSLEQLRCIAQVGNRSKADSHTVLVSERAIERGIANKTAASSRKKTTKEAKGARA